ncbi:pre-peptidase C-terminal domain-containing protein [Pleionea sp. CnH1-48]|uniref:pre-peptidase C-terminal domain-containing protein n=1 Tax=Pleionea sp. CnH1-48 TaxID=2954494 RepID=UPI002097C75A|nr:pre-peptidase C-terminal domain-containing protein [Pleionea sp. CnH1-48]MCO7223548.1 M12 family metallopeptidase [Pleionea sp. CnH1-48]
MTRLNAIVAAMTVTLSTATIAHQNTSTPSHFKLSNSNQIERVEIDGREFYQYDDMLVLADDSIGPRKMDLTKNKWTDGKVYYTFDPAVTQENRQRFVEATKVWESVAQLTFIEDANATNHIYVRNDNKNFATVGMIGGRQNLSMNNWEVLYIIVHELGHSLGMWHEQQRADRDNYVEIKTENVKPGETHNFTARNTSTDGDYDFLSIMHYGLKAFTTNGEQTIVPKAGYEEYNNFAGQRSYISGGDQWSAALHYGAKIINIPDTHFKNYLVGQFDTNGDNEIDTLEAVKVKTINTPGNGQITSLEGLQYFRHLRTLNAANESISSLPELSKHIRTVDLSFNQITDVDTSWGFSPLISSLIMNNNPLDAYSCANIEFLQGSISTNGVVYNPLANGTNLSCIGEDRNALVSGKVKEDLRSKGPQTYNIDVSADDTRLVVETSNHGDKLEGVMDVYVAFNRQPSVTDFDFRSTQPQNDESITINSPQEGRWYILLSPVGRSFENVDLVATLFQDKTDNSKLLNNQAVTGLTAAQGETLEFTMEVPEGARDLSFVLSGGDGDADLYVRHNAKPTATLYDCRPWLNGNNETCSFSTPSAGVYHVSITGYSAFSGVSLVGSYNENTPPQGGSLNETLSGSAGQWTYFELEIPEGMASLSVNISGGTGDADLYVRPGARPTLTEYNCRPYRNGNAESCAVLTPQAGTWFIGIRGYSSYSNLTLDAEWKP